MTPDKRASQSPTPFFSPKADAEGRDTDQFKTFDALPKAKQEKSLFKKGPRLPKSYDTSDWSLRMFVRSGWPVMLDYGLDSNSVAEVSISVDGIEPLIIKVKPAPRALPIPADWSSPPVPAAVPPLAADTRPPRPPAPAPDTTFPRRQRRRAQSP